ncbi:MAG: DUF4336 domain-containing protein [Xenococcaceae cyanobacterium MO_167.B52]|nr:DUF4336 domain-containing protein [Xenococcaceae cyanobacterium MO_167.B52]
MVNQSSSRDFSWSYWSIVPIYPYGQRRTIRREVIKNSVWTFEQLQGIFYVVVPIRMTVVRLEEGGLLVYAPVAPTIECMRLLQELVAEHGDVKYIILPTISGVEHKVFVAPFARKCPQAQVFVAPDQWSFPINLPLSWLGLPKKRTHILPVDSSTTPFAGQFDYAILDTIDLNLGWFSEVVFYDKRSRTLLVTDTIVSIPENPPQINLVDPYPLLFHSRDQAWDPMMDNYESRRKGWQRIALFAMYFQPSVLGVPQWLRVFRDAFRASDRSKQGYFGLYPFQWQDNWQQCFNSLRGNGRLFVAPILQTLILNRAPKATLMWADKIAQWDFNQIIPCHFDAPIYAQPQEFRQAFAFLENNAEVSKTYPLPKEEFATLQAIDNTICKLRLVPPPVEY